MPSRLRPGLAQRLARRNQLPDQRGFTLIELLVVIIILGILAAVVVFAVGGVGDKGKSSAYAIDARTLRTAEEAHLAQFGTYATEAQLVTAGLLSEESSYHDIVLVGGPGGSFDVNAAFGSAVGSGFGSTFQVGQTSSAGSYDIVCGERGMPIPEGCGTGGGIAIGGTLVVGESFTIPTTNPAVSTSGAVHAYWETMYNGLIALDALGNPQPELATVVPTVDNGGISPDGKTFTFTLRNDVFWHDDNPAGVRRPFTATDVKFTFEKALLRDHGRTRNIAPFLAHWDATAQVSNAIVVVNPTTVSFTFTNPYAPLLKQLNVTEAPMLPAHLYTGNPTLAVLNANVIGTGPFKCADPAATPNPCRSGTDAKVVRNPAYFRAPLPYLDEIIMRPIADATTRKNALVNGEVDYLWDVPEQFVADVEADADLTTEATQSLGGGPNSIDTFILNNTQKGDRAGQIGGPNPTGTPAPHPILGDVNVRKAIFHATNRDAVLAARFGVGKVATAPISSELPQHDPSIVLPPFNVAAADALLDAAGWNGPRTTIGSNTNIRTALNHPREGLDPRVDDGDPFTIEFLIGTGGATDARMAVIDANLATVGIDLNRLAGNSNATTIVFTDRNFDTHFINLAQGYDPQVGIRRSYHTDQVSTTTFTNAAGYKNAIVDNAFDQGVRTLDPAARFALYQQFQQQVALDLPYVQLIETPNVRGYRQACTGFRVFTGLFAERASCS
ncbi:MAG: ABC transporter substrate-binding protein [Acidimicrobiales bacterium]